MEQQRAKKRKRGGNNNQNLRPPIKKGEVRNPKGFSAKGRARMDFKRWIEETCPDAPAEVYEVLYNGAKRGRDFRYVSEFLDRYQGKVPAKNEITGKDGKPFGLVVNVVSKKVSVDTQKLIDMLSDN